MSLLFKQSNKPLLLAYWCDTHVNGTVGLVAPGGIALDDGGWYRPSTVQLELWTAYLAYWDAVRSLEKELNARTFAVFGGDGIDDNRYSKYQLATVNEATAVKASIAVLQPALDVAEKFFYVRGTESHGHGSGALEELVAMNIGAEQDDETGNYSWWALPLLHNDVSALFAHHPPSNSTRPWTVGGGAMRTAEIIVSDYQDTGDKPPDFAAFGHVHHYEDSGDTRRTRVFFSDPFCSVNAFSHRIGYSGRSVTVGGLVFVITPDGEWYHNRFKRAAKRREPWTEK